MLWQLGASVFAHSIMGAQASEALAAAEAPCHDMDMSGMEMDQSAAHDTETAPAQDHGDCKSVCKCPCAGTPALSFVFPVTAPAAPNASATAVFAADFDSVSLANLLRPPI
jgi:hypothetical protein